MNDYQYLKAAGFEGNFLGNHFIDAHDAKSQWIPGHARQIGRFYAPKWSARLYINAGPMNPVWESEPFDDPVTAFVAAQTANWGQ